MAEDQREPLEDLSDDLASAADDGQDLAEELHSQVNDYLANPDPSSTDHEALRDQLSDAILQLEVSHPALSAAMQRVVDSLTASGL